MFKWIDHHLVVTSYIILFIIGAYRLRQLSREMKILLCLIGIALSTDFVLLYLATHHINNLWLMHFYTLLEFSLFMLIFSSWQKNKFSQKLLRLIILIYIPIWFSAKFLLEDFSSFDNFTSSLSGTLLTGIAIYTLLILKKEVDCNILIEKRFWVSTGVLFYFAGNLFIFALGSTIAVWSLHNIINICANICYAGGFLSQRR